MVFIIINKNKHISDALLALKNRLFRMKHYYANYPGP